MYWGVHVLFSESELKHGWRYEVFRLAAISFSGFIGENSILYEGSDLRVYL
jgi:hypothetical protein